MSEVWVRTQGGDRLVRIKDIVAISEKWETTEKCFFNVVVPGHVLGAYERRERAVAVLDEIQGLIAKGCGSAFVYLMPEKE